MSRKYTEEFRHSDPPRTTSVVYDGVLDLLENGEVGEMCKKGSQTKSVHPQIVRSRSTLRSLLAKRHFRTLSLAYHTIGVVYGGLATSPLYMYPSLNIEQPSEDDYLSILSIVFWTLTFIGAIKYTLIVLQADDHGEGGTFALYSLLYQHANIGRFTCSRKESESCSDPANSVSGEEKHGTSFQSRVRQLLETSKAAQKVLFCLSTIGTCMLIGDGVLTPTISVLSAINGLKTPFPSISQTGIMAITAVIIVILFVLQRFGTERVGRYFSPIMIAWLVITPLIGAYNIILFYPRIFKAISPLYIWNFFSRHGKEGWKMLSGILLCISGAEAMFADLGHFNKLSMQLAFMVGVYPSNVITYAGQTAYLIKHPEEKTHGFYNFIPIAIFWPMLLVSTLAAIVASQGLISACFSLIKQSLELDLFPRVRIIHTSKEQEGQVYSPEVNYFLLGLCTAVTVGFRDQVALGNAFGVTVIMVKFITTILFTLVMVVVWGTTPLLVLTFFGFFMVIEGAYLAAVISNIPQGGWLPFVVAIFVTAIMLTWMYARMKKREYETANGLSVDALLSIANIKRVPGVCFFYSKQVDKVPPVISHYLKKVRSLHQVFVLINEKHVKEPTIPTAERFKFSQLGHKGAYGCIVQCGYAEVVDAVEWNEFSENLIQNLGEYIQSLATQLKDSTEEGRARAEDDVGWGGTEESLAEDLAEIETAKEEGPLFVVGKARLVAKEGKNTLKGILIEKGYRILHSASCTPALSLKKISPSNLLEIGALFEV